MDNDGMPDTFSVNRFEETDAKFPFDPIWFKPVEQPAHWSVKLIQKDGKTIGGIVTVQGTFFDILNL